MHSDLSPVEHAIKTADGRRLVYYTLGDSPRLVVCEAGLGMSALYWVPVMQQLAKHCRVVAYDRAGIGSSSPDQNRRDLTRLASDLGEIVSSQTYEELVLVGHSWGAPVVRTYVKHNRSSVQNLMGMVLVDPIVEQLLPHFKPLPLALQRSLFVPLARLKLLARVLKPTVRGLPDDVMKKALQHSSTVNAARESAAEISLLRTGLEELFASDLDDKTPLALISGALTMPGESKKMRGIIQRAHEQAVANHAGSRFITAERSGHNVPITEPAVVAESVMRFFK